MLAGTPIGNLSDATPALRQMLTQADVIAAEDTRRAKKLLAGLGLETGAHIVSYYDQNETTRTPELLGYLRDDKTVLVVTDAGMPTVSDPGYRIVRAAIESDIAVTTIPGPSAVVTALAVSGLPTDRFCFEGFLPRKAGERKTRLDELATEMRTMIFFEAPHRLLDFLNAAIDVFGATRQASVSREMTKVFEETKRGTLADLAVWAQTGIRGEITICIAGAPTTQTATLAETVSQVLDLAATGVPLAAAATQLAAMSGYARNQLYQSALQARKETP